MNTTHTGQKCHMYMYFNVSFVCTNSLQTNKFLDELFILYIPIHISDLILYMSKHTHIQPQRECAPHTQSCGLYIHCLQTSCQVCLAGHVPLYGKHMYKVLFVQVHVHMSISLYVSIETPNDPSYCFFYTDIKLLSKSRTLLDVPGTVCPLLLSLVPLLGQYLTATTYLLMCPGILLQTIHYHQPIASQPSLIRLSRCAANLSTGQVFSLSVPAPSSQVAGRGWSPKMLMWSHISLHRMPVVTILIGPN